MSYWYLLERPVTELRIQLAWLVLSSMFLASRATHVYHFLHEAPAGYLYCAMALIFFWHCSQPSHSAIWYYALQDSDREKLHLARQRHAIEEQEAEGDALKEKRKEERAAKRAARKEAASRRSEDAAVSAAADDMADLPQHVSRSKVTVGSTAASR